MSYSQWIGRKHPGCIVVLVDQSGSMKSSFSGATGTKADECAKAVNRVVREIALVSAAGSEILRRCYIGVIGYGSRVASAIGKASDGSVLVPIDELAGRPIRVESIRQKVNDGAGGLVDAETRFPVWIESCADNGTPMTQGFRLAQSSLGAWVSAHRSSFPPVVINITDGEPDDVTSAEQAAQELRGLETDDGRLLLLNVHISSSRARPVVLPTSNEGLPDANAAFLYRISSELPDPMRVQASGVGLRADPGCRGFIFNADADMMIRLLTFGTAPTKQTQTMSMQR